MPRISVVIPTYNRAGYIAETIQSVIDQTYVDWELIVLDDGSTDETAQVVAHFGERVKYVYQDNAGETGARNAGYAVTTGEYLTFLDSDDRMLPHNLECLAKILDEQPEVGVAYGWYYWMDAHGEPIFFEDPPLTGYSISPQDSPWPHLPLRPSGTTLEGKIFSRLVLEETMLMGSTLIRRECIEAVGGFDAKIPYQGHWDFYLRVARAGYAFACCKRPVVIIRLHPGNRGRNIDGMLASRVHILERLFAEPESDVLPAAVRHQAYYQAYIGAARDSFANGLLEKGCQSLRKALSHTPQLPGDNAVRVISEWMISHSLNEKVPDPIRFAQGLFDEVGEKYKTGRLRRKVLGEVYAGLAFRSSSTQPRRVWRYGLQAILHDPGLIKNRGLVRLTLENLLAPEVVDWIRSRRYPLDAEFFHKISGKTCIFISPHFDDAALSCGGTLAELARRHADLFLITVFTADLPPSKLPSALAKKLHDLWNLGAEPFKQRALEEKQVAEYLGASYLWLGFEDVIYRYPNLKPTEESFEINIKPQEDVCFQTVHQALLQIIQQHPGAIIFAPLGIGHHPDHLLVHEAIETIRAMNSGANSYYYYEDFPYATQGDLAKRLAELNWRAGSLSVDIAATLEERVRMIQMYPSQLSSLFDDTTNIRQAVESYATRVGTRGKPRERFWFHLDDR